MLSAGFEPGIIIVDRAHKLVLAHIGQQATLLNWVTTGFGYIVI